MRPRRSGPADTWRGSLWRFRRSRSGPAVTRAPERGGAERDQRECGRGELLEERDGVLLRDEFNLALKGSRLSRVRAGAASTSPAWCPAAICGRGRVTTA